MPQLVQVGEEVVQFPDDFSQEQIEGVLREQFPPSQAEPAPAEPAAKPEPEVGPAQAFGLSLATGIAPAFAARYGGRLGTALGITSGPGLLAAGFGGAVGAAALTDVAQRKLLESTVPGYKEYEEAAYRQQPWASRAGGFLSGASAFRIQPFKGISALPSFLKGTATEAQRKAAIELGATTGLGAAAGVVSPLLEGQRPTLESGVTGAAFGAFYGGPRQFRGRLAAIAQAKRLLPNAAAEATKGVAEDASRIREDAEQVRQADELQGRAGEGRPDLEQPAPGEPGRAAPGTQAVPSEKGLPGILLDNRPAIKLMPDEAGNVSYVEAELKPDGTWETHDEIIERADIGTEQIDRRVFRDRLGAEKSREQVDKELAAYGVASKVPGEAHSTDVNKLAEPPKPAAAPKVYTLEPGKKMEQAVVSPEIDPVLDAERAAIDNPIDVVEDTPAQKAEREYYRATEALENAERAGVPEAEMEQLRQDVIRLEKAAITAEEAEPFATSRVGANDFMTVDPERGTVVINRQGVQDWLNRDVPRNRWNQAMRARLVEESLHLRTPPEDGVTYWNALTWFERYTEARTYLGPNWRARMARQEFSPQQLGLEAIRARLQRLNGMSRSEVVESALKERWTLRGLQVLSDVVRKLREGLGTKASAEQRAIIERIAGNLDAAKAALGQPAATRRQIGKGTPEFYMPPVARGETVERTGFPLPKGTAVQEIAKALWADPSKVPSLDEFTAQAEGRFGSLKPQSLYDAWQDAMIARLMTAKGAEVEALMDKLGLRPEVARALKPGEAAPMLGKGTIPDALDMPATQMSLAEVEQFFKQRQWKTKPAFRQKFGPEQRRRYAAIGEIVGKLSEQAGPKPKTPTTRTEIGPEDVSQVWQMVKEPGRRVDPETNEVTYGEPDVRTYPTWYAFKPEDVKDPVALGKFAVQGARVGPTTKFTISNNIMALRGPDGKIYVVSVWNDTRTGPKITNPRGTDQTARNIDSKLLREYQPMVLARLRSPVEKFRQVFDTQEHFDNHFGDIGIEGTEGLGTSSFVGPQAGAVRAQAGLPGAGRPPAAEAALPKPFHGTPPLLQASLLISGARELSVPRFARRAVPREALPEPAPRPTAPAMIEGMPPLAIEPPTGPARMPYETPPRRDLPITGAPPMGPGWPLRVGAQRGKYIARPAQGYRTSAPYQPTERRYPAATRRLTSELELLGRDILDMVKAAPTEQRIVNGIDSAGNKANNLANQGENRARFASAQRPAGLIERLKGRWQMGKPDVLAAANVLVESVYDPARAMWRGYALRLHTRVGDFDPRAIPLFRHQIERGRARAQARLLSPDYRVRKIGEDELRAYDQYKKELDYAEAHWNDPELQETARRLRGAYNRQYQELVRRGVNVSLEPGFNPHRYDAAVWNGHSYIFNMSRGAQKVLGERTLANRTFDSYYHAFGHDAFLPITRDSASLLGHYLRRTNHLMFREEWRQTLKSMKLPNGQELAADPKQGKNQLLSHKLDYVVVHDGGKGLSVHQDYAKLVQRLVDPSAFEASPVLKSALSLSQQLKHSLLAGDFFHLGRMLYYANAVMGTKMGYQAGWSVLDIAPRDIPEAVRKGIIRQKDADWANERIALPRGRSMTRRDIVAKFYQEMGANLGRVQDALYKDLLTAVQPTSGPLRRAFVKVVDPSVGRYNRFLFDRLTRGFMAESVAREFERQMKANPNVSPKALMRDIARDVNNFFGNIGRQGWAQNRTVQDINRLMWLAPQWVEGLIKKEAIGYGRLTGATKALGLRQGPQQGYVRQLGTTGRAIGRGMLTMIAITQALNLISRRQPTWMNEEKEHKWDAWIPGRGAESEGFWFSPLAIFNEISHDIYRLWMSKPTFADAITQIMGNKEQPVMRATLVGLTGQSPLGQRITTTPGRLKEMGKAVLPVPISFGRVSQYGLSKAGIAPPPPPGSVQRQIFATLGIKIEPKDSSVQEVGKLAREFVRREGLDKTTGWQQIQTDEPGYSKLRSALRSGDDRAARRNLEALRKNRSDKEIMAGMKAWKDRGFTGSKKAEREFKNTLTDKQWELYDKATEQKQLLYEKFLDWFYRQD